MSVVIDWRANAPEGQLDENACWGACLHWWLKAMGNGRPSWSQKQVLQEYVRSTNASGGIDPEAMSKAWKADSRLKMTTLILPTPNPVLDKLPLGDTPVCIAFKHPTGFAHMNVIWKSKLERHVWCMEPFWPFPWTGAKLTGRKVERNLDHFNVGNNVILAWGRDASGGAGATPAETNSV